MCWRKSKRERGKKRLRGKEKKRQWDSTWKISPRLSKEVKCIEAMARNHSSRVCNRMHQSCNTVLLPLRRIYWVKPRTIPLLSKTMKTWMKNSTKFFCSLASTQEVKNLTYTSSSTSLGELSQKVANLSPRHCHRLWTSYLWSKETFKNLMRASVWGSWRKQISIRNSLHSSLAELNK